MEKQMDYFRGLLKNSGVIDVIIFGSSVRGKDKPRDLDVCVVWNDKKGKTKKAIDITYEELFSPSFLAREDILCDGFSLRLNQGVAEAYGYFAFRTFDYQLTNMDYNERARFHSAMRQVTDELGIVKFRALALVPIGASEKFKEFLKYWKVNYRESRMLFPRQEYEFIKDMFPIHGKAEIIWDNTKVADAEVVLRKDTGAFFSDGNFDPDKLKKDFVSGMILKGILKGDIKELKAAPFFRLNIKTDKEESITTETKLDPTTFPSTAGQLIYGKIIKK